MKRFTIALALALTFLSTAASARALDTLCQKGDLPPRGGHRLLITLIPDFPAKMHKTSKGDMLLTTNLQHCVNMLYEDYGLYQMRRHPAAVYIIDWDHVN